MILLTNWDAHPKKRMSIPSGIPVFTSKNQHSKEHW